MNKRSVRKLQLTRETLSHLTPAQVGRVRGDSVSDYCQPTLESVCDLCQQSATCGCGGTVWSVDGMCNSGVCTQYSIVC